MYMYMHMCMYVYIYIYMHTHTHTAKYKSERESPDCRAGGGAPERAQRDADEGVLTNEIGPRDPN